MDTEKELDVLLKECGSLVTKESNIDLIMEKMADFATNLLQADRCSIFFYDEIKNELWTKVAQGIDEIRICAKKGIAGYAALSKEIQIVADAYDDNRFNQEIDKQTGYRTRSVLAVPMVDQNNNTLGVFQVLNKKDSVFTDNDARLLQRISSCALDSIENALLDYKLK